MEDSILDAAPTLRARYQLERELGRGGMARVYLAEERKHRRQVAIKVLHPEIAASLGTERFLREIGIVAQLAHPHVVPLIDSGEADGLLYYVTPYVRGGSLRDRLQREPRLSLDDTLRIARELGAALDHAHRAGFIHRDVKPENILFADGMALLTDFGVARAFEAICEERSVSPATAVTTAGLALGTPAYMSPEQAAGERDIGVASDVYSLACVIYEALAGEPPFSGSSARRLMARHITEAPPPLRTRRPEVPAGVDAAVTRALAKDAAQRFPSAGAFVEAIANAVDDARRSDSAPQLARRATHSIAVLPFVNASPDAANEYLSDGITDEIIDALSKVRTLRVASRTSVFALKGRSLDVRAIGAMLGATVVLEGSVRRQGDRLRVTAQLTATDDDRLLWSQRYDRELQDVFTVQDELARTIVTTLRATWLADIGDPAPKRGTENVAAYGHYLRGRWAMNQRTDAATHDAIDHFERAIAEDPAYALAYTGLADAYALHVDYRSVPSSEGLERAVRYARKALDIDEGLAEAHTSLGWALFIYFWEFETARSEFRRALELDPRYPTAHQWYAFFLAAVGRLDEGLVEGHTAQELDPASVSIRRTVGWLYYYARRFDRARYHLERAIEMNPTSEESYRILGLSLAVEGRAQEAVATLREAIAMPGAGTLTQGTLAYALDRAGLHDEASTLRASLEARAAREYISSTSIATAYMASGDHARTLDWLERAHAERRGWVVYLNVNPLMDHLRGEPRFAALIERMALPPG